MLKSIPFLVFMMTTSIAWCQVMVVGTVMSHEDGHPIPGVMVVEKGTENETVTNAAGEFSLRVADPYATLEFLFIGFRGKEQSLKGQTEIHIILKSDCNKDFFDAHKVALYANHGLLHTPIGGRIEISSPYTSWGVVKGMYSYQTNGDENQFHAAEVELSHPISTCEFDMDFRWSHRNVSFNERVQSVTNTGEVQLNVRNISFIGGYTHLTRRSFETHQASRSSGVLLGMQKEIFIRPMHATLSAKVSVYANRQEYQASFTSGYKWLLYAIRYNKIDSFDEVSIGVGTMFSYYKRKQH